jgi:predicted membrane-bound spermidine synthase
MSAPPGQRRLAVAAGLAAGALLMQEVLIARLLSVLTWYSLGYLALSLGLLGMTAGALVVHVRPAWFSPERFRQSSGVALMLGAVLTVAFGAWLVRQRVVMNPLEPASTGLVVLQLAVGFALPFAAAGSAISALLTRAERTGLVYAVDLLGSSLGALLAAPLLGMLGAPRALVGTGVLLAVAAAVVVAGPRLRWGALALAAGVAATAGFADLRVRYAKGQRLDATPMLAEGWNSISHVAVSAWSTGVPFYWGPLVNAPDAPVRQSFLRIDGEAGTAAYSFQDPRTELRFLLDDVTSAVHWLRPEGDALIIGVGGGRDIAAALVAGHARVQGVEVNPLLVRYLETVLGAEGKIAGRPEVRIAVEDGRSWLARSDARFDTIVVSLVDTWASTGAGAMTLTENSLYTAEAWELFLDRLTERGMLSFSRWYSPSRPVELARVVTLAVEALRRAGVREPREHLVVVAVDQVATVLVGRSPFTEAELSALRSRQERGVEVLLAPGGGAGSKLLEEVARAKPGPELEALATRLGVELRPPVDDRPFFFLQVPLSAWVQPERLKAILAPKSGLLFGNVVATGATAITFAVALLLSLLWLAPAFGGGGPAFQTLPRGGRPPVLLWFAGIGAGFMIFEIGTAQRLNLILGDPTWAIALTLAPLTLGSGLGARLSEGMDPRNPWHLRAAPLAAALLLAAWAAIPPAWITALLAREFPVRAAVCVIAAGLPGIPLGFCFPLAMRRVREVAPRVTAWCWGVNGVLSVLGTGASLFISITSGIRVTLLVASAIYAALVLLAPRLARLAAK